MKNRTFPEAKILIIDDQEANIEVLLDLLEMQGYSNFMTSTDSRKTVTLYKSFQPDIILLDLMMPYFSGFEVLEQLSAIIPEDEFLPILVLTADINQESRLKALKNGASDFIVKPLDLIEVDLRIKNLLFSRHYYTLYRNRMKE